MFNGRERLFLWGVVAMVAGLCLLSGASRARENQDYAKAHNNMLQLDSVALVGEYQLPESVLDQHAAFMPSQSGIAKPPILVEKIDLACCHRKPLRAAMRHLVCRRC